MFQHINTGHNTDGGHHSISKGWGQLQQAKTSHSPTSRGQEQPHSQHKSHCKPGAVRSTLLGSTVDIREILLLLLFFVFLSGWRLFFWGWLFLFCFCFSFLFLLFRFLISFLLSSTHLLSLFYQQSLDFRIFSCK